MRRAINEEKGMTFWNREVAQHKRKLGLHVRKAFLNDALRLLKVIELLTQNPIRELLFASIIAVMKEDQPFAAPKNVSNIADCYFYHIMDLPGYGTVGQEWD